MRALRIAGRLALAVLVLDGAEAGACGDKFVRVGRGGRFQRGYVAIHPASILVYVNRASAGAAAMRGLPATLKAAGHKAVAADGVRAFGEALKLRRYDVVLAEIDEIPHLEGALHAASPRPAVVPVLRRPSPAQVEAAARRHACVIEDADKKYDVLLDLDALLEGKK